MRCINGAIKNIVIQTTKQNSSLRYDGLKKKSLIDGTIGLGTVE